MLTFALALGDPITHPQLAQRCQQNDQRKKTMPGMDMSGKNAMDMGDMGPSMAAMAGHMYITPLRPKQPGDEQKVKDVVAKLKATMDRYKDYRKALNDGYVIANPKLKQAQYHFLNDANTHEADLQFDPTKPTALLYRRTPMQEYKLEGAMFTTSPDATEDELNRRIPLSVVRWHRHVNYCAAPEDRVNDYQAQHPKFGMFGSINTQEACTAEGGTFHPFIFTWMIHVFPLRNRPQTSLLHERRHPPRPLIDDIPAFTVLPPPLKTVILNPTAFPGG